VESCDETKEEKSMLTRKRFLGYGFGAGAALLFPHRFSAFAATTPALDPSLLTKFSDALPLPTAAAPVGPSAYHITMSQFRQRLHSEMPPTTVWGYDQSYPGPTIEARSGEPISVTWSNELPTQHLLPIDRTLDGADTGPDVRAVTHLHGGHVPPAVDGGPLDWFVPGESRVFTYPNAQHAATLWYHDHALGITRLNVFAGLAGFYLLRDPVEDALPLPAGSYEVPLVIQDRAFFADGELRYPDEGVTHPVWVPEFFGDTILVNGKVWPYLEVEPRRYRFRILNGSNARFYELFLSNGEPIRQIGSDGGLLESAVALNRLLLAPGERADVIVDFTGQESQSILLRNTAKAPFPNGDAADPRTVGQIMQFRVTRPLAGVDTSDIPPTLRPIERLAPASAAAVRDIPMFEHLDADDEPITVQLEGLDFDDPATIFARRGTTEVWRLINTTGDAHPIHLHLVQFQVVSRQRFDTRRYSPTGPPTLIGQSKPPNANELGWKDTVRANPGEVTTIVARFDDFTGTYPFHCHILEHEDNDMMRPFEVVA